MKEFTGRGRIILRIIFIRIFGRIRKLTRCGIIVWIRKLIPDSDIGPDGF